MVKTHKLKSKFIWTIIILVGLIAAFSSAILHNGDVVFKKTESQLVIKKLKDIQAKGGVFELTQKDIDEVCSLYFENPKNNGGVTVKGINVEMLNDEILIKAPISYKNLNLLLTSRGKLKFLNGNITYVMGNFKIGNLMLPKKLVIHQISKLSNKNLYTQDDLIKISSKVFPFKINNFKIGDNKIVGTAQKLDIRKLFDSLDKKIGIQTGEELARAQQERQGGNENFKKVEKVEEKVEEKVQKKKGLEKIRAEVKKSRQVTQKKEENTLDTQVQAANKRLALNKVNGELKDAYSKVESSKEKQVVSIMILAVGKLQSNPSYNSTSDQIIVKAMYRKLDSKSKDRLKIALFTSINEESVEELKKSFGL